MVMVVVVVVVVVMIIIGGKAIIGITTIKRTIGSGCGGKCWSH